MKKKYGAAESYEKKLKNVMDRIGADRYDFDWGRKACNVEFFYNGQAYRFESGIDTLKERGIELSCGSDAFAILVLDLESIARMMEHGTFDLKNQKVNGLKQLAAPVDIPECFRMLGFQTVPESVAQIKESYLKMAKNCHPDKGGDEAEFVAIKNAYEDAARYFMG